MTLFQFQIRQLLRALKNSYIVYDTLPGEWIEEIDRLLEAVEPESGEEVVPW